MQISIFRKLAVVRLGIKIILAVAVILIANLIISFSLFKKSGIAMMDDISSEYHSNQQFKIAYEKSLEADTGELVTEKERPIYNFTTIDGINIDESTFSELSIKLNTEIYGATATIWNKEHLEAILSKYPVSDERKNSKFAKSCVEYFDPLMVLALTGPETSGDQFVDDRYTWTSAIYSGAFEDEEMTSVSLADMSTAKFKEAGKIRYIACNTMGDGAHCPGKDGNLHIEEPYEVGPSNLDDSLGAIQILRRYITDKNYSFKCICGCGRTAEDLLCWEDTILYELGDYYMSLVINSTRKDLDITTPYQIMALLGSSHNLGMSDADTYVDYCMQIGSGEKLAIIKGEVEEWYEWYTDKIRNNQDAYIVGNSSWWVEHQGYGSISNFIESKLGITVDRSTDRTIRGYTYPVQVIATYLALQMLYISGGGY